MIADVVPVLALGVLLLVAYRHPPEWVEAGAGLGCAAAVLLLADLPLDDAEDEVRLLAPVVVFLMAILLVAECCRAEGLFAAVGDRIRAAAPRRVFALVFLAAALTTVVLSLDATVVLLTPVVVVAAGAGVRSRLACVRLANSASLLLPVSNLTNLLAFAHLDLSFGRFVLLMAPVWLVLLLVEYAGMRLLVPDDPAAPRDAAARPRPLPRVPLIVIAVMLAGFAVASTLGIAAAWPAGLAALVLVTRALASRRIDVPSVARHLHVSFAVYVLCLGVVVAGLGRAWLGDALAAALPDGDGLVALLLLAALGALLANLVNNLPATLLLVPLVAPLGATAVLAVLVGVNVGSSLTWTGSLANLLWRRSLDRSGASVPGRDFHRLGLLVTPAGIVLGVLTLAGWSSLIYGLI